MKRITSAFRYPGSKEKIAKSIQKWFPDCVHFACLQGNLSCYCEPFVGCGAMATKILPMLPRTARIILADKDHGIVCLWRSVLEQPEAFAKKLLNFRPSVDKFKQFKQLDGCRDDDTLTVGFRKFALHQMSFSGLGAKAGGPIGGMKQRSDYAVDCRYRPERHVLAIAKQHKMLRRFHTVEVMECDFSTALREVPADGFAYLDPPYYLKGGELYAHNMDHADHERLALLLWRAEYSWVLSYDDRPEVRALYKGWSDINTFEMTATIDSKRGSGSRRKNHELVITKQESQEAKD